MLIPTDTSLRVLELAYLLEQLWSFQRLPFPIVFFSHKAKQTLGLAKNMLEWMGEAAAQSFSATKENPFEFRCVKLAESMQDLEAISGPKLVLASFTSMNVGYSSVLFRDWSVDPANMIILPERGGPGTLARTLFESWKNLAQDGDQDDKLRPPVDMDLEVSLPVKEKIPLEGDELAEHLAAELARKELEEAAAAQRDEEQESDEDEDELMDAEQSGGPSGTAVAAAMDASHHPFDVYIRDIPRSSGFFKHAQAYRMFPVVEPRVRVDDYGEIIDPRAYMREEEQNAIEFSALQKGDGDGANKEVDVDMDVSKEDTVLESEQYHGGQGLRLEDAVPSKYVEYTMDLKVCCKVVFIDFEGRSDGKSIKNILAQVAPRKLV